MTCVDTERATTDEGYRGWTRFPGPWHGFHDLAPCLGAIVLQKAADSGEIPFALADRTMVADCRAPVGRHAQADVLWHEAAAGLPTLQNWWPVL